VAVVVAGTIITGHLTDAVVAAVGLTVAVSIARRPQRGILLAVALVPLDGLRLPLNIDGAVASWKEGLALFTAACAVLSAKKVAERVRPDWFWWLVALVTVAAVWFGIHQSKAALWGLKLDFVYLALAYAAWRCPLDAKDRDRFVSILMGVGVLAAAYGVAQQLLGHARLHELGYEYNSVLRFNGGFLRSVSTFALPFSFGFFMMMVIIICLPVALSNTSRLRNKLFLISTPLLVVGLATSIVRTAMLGLLVGLLYIGIRRYRSVIAVLVPLGLVALFFIPGSSATKALSSDSTKARSANWTENIDAVADHPFGLGVGETGAAKARSYGQTPEEQAAAFGIDLNQPDADVYTPILGGNGVYQPDNYYLKTVIELGVLGLWFLIRLLVGAVRESRALERAPDATDSAFGIGITAFLFAVIFSMLFATYLELFPMDAYFWLLLGVTAATAREYGLRPGGKVSAAPAEAAGAAR
jgi:O-antigen ligase